MNKSFCALPWIHIHPMPSGVTHPCCVWNKNYPVGNINDNTLTEIIHSPKMNEIRAKMLKGEPVEGCQEYCISHENSGHSRTKRNTINELFKNIIPEIIEQTNEDGSFKNPNDFKMRHLNIRYSNLCNFKCRSCNSEFSSLISQEKYNITKAIEIHDNKIDIMPEVLASVKDVELLHIAGGESVLIDEHWVIMDKLLELGKTDTKIVLTTNLSKLTYKDKNLIDYIKKFKDFELFVSIDAYGERAELFRDGTIWNQIEDNLRELMREDIRFLTSCTVGATNIHHAPDLHRYLMENELINPHRFIFNILTQPNYLSCKILPADFKKIVNDRLINHKNYLDSINVDSAWWPILINFLNDGDDSHLLPTFIDYHKMLDHKRKQDTFKTYPELNQLL
jgi:sulfatase maturation enzyme AslB (radical SAM superfamily)